MGWFHRRRECLIGALFGAWLGFAYAFSSQAINRIFLPGIPLAEPGGSYAGYLVQYLLLGAFFGAITALPDNRLAAVVLGGAASSVTLSVIALAHNWGVDSFGSTVVTVMLTFLPLTVLFFPLALFVRIGTDSQNIDPDRPYLWARRFIIPALLSVIVVIVGSFSLYATEARAAFRYVDQMTREGLSAPTTNELPKPLADVVGFKVNAGATYTMAWSDRVETFFGPRPAGSEMSQFLIITRFENGFAFACVFSENRNVPNCTNY